MMIFHYKHGHFIFLKKLCLAILCCTVGVLCSTYAQNSSIVTGAERLDEYISDLKNKNIAIVANQTTIIKKEHLVDVLLNEGVNVQKVFSPEHGFRGKSDAGEKVKDEFDLQTGLPIYSLYGKAKRKPSKELLKDVDIMLFDLQDVGARFYTYISTLHYVMEACAENDIPLYVFDRPNPNGFYVDGPILETKYKSFIGMHPIPVVHGLTIGEYASMINGEKWLNDSLHCKLKIITCENYDHSMKYRLPIPPSPNLPNMKSVYLYPSLCFFEGTNVSVGRGTSFPFQVYGAPYLKKYSFNFTPKSMFGAKHPKHQGEKCFGQKFYDLNEDSLSMVKHLNFNWLVETFHTFGEDPTFFNKNNFFNLLAGSDKLMNLIKGGANASQIRETYQNELKEFKVLRKKYLLYPDFE